MPNKNNLLPLLPTLAQRILWCAQQVGGKAKLARLAGISEAQMFRYIAEESDIPANKLANIANAAHTDAGWLLSGTNTQPAYTQPEFCPRLLTNIHHAIAEALIDYDGKLSINQRSALASFVYETMRWEEACLNTVLQPNRSDILEILAYLGKESFDELLNLHQQAYQYYALNQGPSPSDTWHEFFTNAVRLGHKHIYNGLSGSAFFRRVGYTLPEHSVGRLLNLLHIVGQTFKPHKPLKWLDVGCGNGREIIFLHKHRPDIEFYGADSSNIALKALSDIAKNGSLNANHFTESDMRVLPWPDASFGVVYSRMSLYCLPALSNNHGLAEAVAEIARVCAPGGFVALTTTRGKGQLYLPYIQFVEPENLIDLAQKNGLQLVSREDFEAGSHKTRVRPQTSLLLSKP